MRDVGGQREIECEAVVFDALVAAHQLDLVFEFEREVMQAGLLALALRRVEIEHGGVMVGVAVRQEGTLQVGAAIDLLQACDVIVPFGRGAPIVDPIIHVAHAARTKKWLHRVSP